MEKKGQNKNQGKKDHFSIFHDSQFFSVIKLKREKMFRIVEQIFSTPKVNFTNFLHAAFT
jgi:hypothetical protein